MPEHHAPDRHRVHSYRASAHWTGSTGAGYRGYDRTHAVELDGPGETTVSADPAFRGDPAHANPEQLLLAAAVSCQLLSFLAVAARAGVDVLDYTDSAEADMPQDARNPMKITRITLRPRITLASIVDPDTVAQMVEQAHRECFIANTLDTEMVIEPSVVTASTARL